MNKKKERGGLDEFYRDVRLCKKERRESWYQENMDLLKSSGLKYKMLSKTHFRIMGKVDFWPSTGRFKLTADRYAKSGGFHKMVKELKK